MVRYSLYAVEQTMPPALRENKATDSAHDMGANKGVVPMPHLARTRRSSISTSSGAVTRRWLSTAYRSRISGVWHGRAERLRSITSIHTICSSPDPDSCLSQFLTDPRGTLEVKVRARALLSCASTRRRPRLEPR